MFWKRENGSETTRSSPSDLGQPGALDGADIERALKYPDGVGSLTPLWPRREFLLGVAGSLLSACRVMAQIEGTRSLLTVPVASEWLGVLGALVPTILPFEHPRFPAVGREDVEAELRRLFAIDDDPDFATLPRALLLFDDVPAFESPPAPIVDDQVRDLAERGRRGESTGIGIDEALARDRAEWASYESRYGRARFVDQSIEARRAYLSLWSASELLTRRRFYRGAKSLVCITAYSLRPFWEAVGYEGPLLGRG